MKNNNQNKEMEIREMSAEEMEQAAGGYLGFLLPISKKIGTELVKLFS